ncbi:MAG: hydroxysqualene dehydroxylase HpnE [Acidobacteriota bacterium]
MSGGIIPQPVTAQPDVLVAGGGIAGLCAAVELASRGWSVVLAERSRHLGGRAYSFIHPDTGDEVDNGQHLMLGCYHAARRYMETVGTISDCTLQDSLSIPFRSATGSFELRAARLPSPLHIAGALVTLKTLSLRDRLMLLRIAPSLLLAGEGREAHLRSVTVSEWLDETGQSEAAKRSLWNILAIGTLNERPEQASAALFVHVLRTVFLGAPSDASVLLPRRGLSRIFGDAGASYLSSHHGCVRMKTPVRAMRIAAGRVTSVDVGCETLHPRAVISAVPQYAIGSLFADDAAAHIPMLAHAARFAEVPIVSIHLWFDAHFMDEHFTALLDSPIDWIFNRTKIARQENPGGLMQLSLVVSAARMLAGQPKHEIIGTAMGEVKRMFPSASSARLVHALVVKEKRATFSPVRGVEAFRPAHETPVKNLFIAGDWTDTKLPATIEGAAGSGYACAELAHALLKHAS